MKNIILIGMPSTGKSTVGVILAKRLGFGFVDCDILLAQKEGRTLPEILETDGLDHFLILEGKVGESVDCEKTVVATGGSMVFSARAMAQLKRDSLTIWLDTPLETLEQRLSAASRHDRGVAAPAELSIAEIYAQRAPLYEKYADHRICCGQGTDRVVSQIQELLNRLRGEGIL